MSKLKPLAQIAYEADRTRTHIDFWGPWEKASPRVQAVYKTEAKAVAREVMRRLKAKEQKEKDICFGLKHVTTGKEAQP